MLLQIIILNSFVRHIMSATYFHVGCFQDRFNPRAMPVRVGTVTNPTECFDKVKGKGWQVFGTQYGQECWSGQDANITYWKYGNTTKCKNNMGSGLANDVFIIHYENLSTTPIPSTTPSPLKSTTAQNLTKTRIPSTAPLTLKKTTAKNSTKTLNPSTVSTLQKTTSQNLTKTLNPSMVPTLQKATLQNLTKTPSPSTLSSILKKNSGQNSNNATNPPKTPTKLIISTSLKTPSVSETTKPPKASEITKPSKKPPVSLAMMPLARMPKKPMPKKPMARKAPKTSNPPSSQKPPKTEDECRGWIWFNKAQTQMASGLIVVACVTFNLATMML